MLSDIFPPCEAFKTRLKADISTAALLLFVYYQM